VGRRDEGDRERVRAVGERVRRLREAQGLTQEDLAEAASVHRAEIGFIERAEREVGIALAWRIADGLGITLSELVSGLD
jgi:transcriptional regulator with XRE-family HTH domain